MFEKIQEARCKLQGELPRWATASNVRVLPTPLIPACAAVDNRTQVILQWDSVVLGAKEIENVPFDIRIEQGSPDPGVNEIGAIARVLEDEAAGKYEVDGHDVGSGTVNFFLLTENAEVAIERVIVLYGAGLLRQGMRVGVPDAGFYRPIFPIDLKQFSLF